MRGEGEVRQALADYGALICLVSRNWKTSRACRLEYRMADALHKLIYCAELEPYLDSGYRWQRCELFGKGPTTQSRLGAVLRRDPHRGPSVPTRRLQRRLHQCRRLSVAAAGRSKSRSIPGMAAT